MNKEVNGIFMPHTNAREILTTCVKLETIREIFISHLDVRETFIACVRLYRVGYLTTPVLLKM